MPKHDDIPIIPVEPVPQGITIPNTIPTVQATPYDGATGPPAPMNPTYYNNQAAPFGNAPVVYPTASTAQPLSTPQPIPIQGPGVQRNNSNRDAWYIIGGSIACTATICCCLYCIIPLVIFLVIFFTALSEPEEYYTTFDDDFFKRTYNPN